MQHGLRSQWPAAALLSLRVRKTHVLDDLAECPAEALPVNSAPGGVAPKLVFRRTGNRCAYGIGFRMQSQCGIVMLPLPLQGRLKEIKRAYFIRLSKLERP